MSCNTRMRLTAKRVITRIWTAGGPIAVCLLAIALGCSPAPPSMEELGRIVYDPSQVPGFDRPYSLPHGLGEESPPPATDASPEQADVSPSPTRSSQEPQRESHSAD